MFDGVQVNDFHVSFFKHQVVNAANVETYPVNFVGVKGLNKGTELWKLYNMVTSRIYYAHDLFINDCCDEHKSILLGEKQKQDKV